ncbi:MAG TPA: hypothetical protein VF277_02820 [Steroidobacteraceae bacterium]
MQIQSTIRLAALAVTAALAACAGNGNGLDGNGRPIGEGTGGGPLTADFDSIQANVFTPICTVCHAGAGAPQGLRLDAANSYDLLVGVPSNEAGSVLRVKPGDPDHSYLIQKLEGRASVGARMPFGGPYLDQATIDVIRQWITDGAQRSPAAATKPALAIDAVVPAPGDSLPAAPTRIVVGVTSELDRTRIDATSVQLQAQMPAGGATTIVATQVVVPDANPRSLVITPIASLQPGHYVLRMDGAAVTDLSGTTLDAAPDGLVEITNFDVGAGP